MNVRLGRYFNHSVLDWCRNLHYRFFCDISFRFIQLILMLWMILLFCSLFLIFRSISRNRCQTWIASLIKFVQIFECFIFWIQSLRYKRKNLLIDTFPLFFWIMRCLALLFHRFYYKINKYYQKELIFFIFEAIPSYEGQ